MSIDKTTQLISTRNEENANPLLRVGWTLLLIVDRKKGGSSVAALPIRVAARW